VTTPRRLTEPERTERTEGVTEDDDLYFRQVLVGPMANFIYLIGSRSAGECLVVDPAWDIDGLIELAEQDDMRVTGSLVTHYHPDHVGGSIMGFTVPGGVAELVGKLGGKVHVNKHEADGLIRVTGVSESDLARHDAGDTLELGRVKIQLVHTPGHTPGSQCFLVQGQGLVAGDTLFVGGCGRVDLPGANPDQMYESLQTLAELDERVVLYPGHDYGPTPTSTIGEQRQSNRYLRISSLEQWQRMMGRG